MTEALSVQNLSIMCVEGKENRYDDAITPCSPKSEEISRMRHELEKTRRSLAENERKLSNMTRIQSTVDAEVQELTEKLFQEAYKMVNVAEEKRERSDKLMNEAQMKVELLTAEVAALKELVQAPGMGRNHFQNTSPEHKSALAKFFSSHSSNSRKSQSPVSKDRKAQTLPTTTQIQKEVESEQREADAVEEIDEILLREFNEWRTASHPVADHPFIERILSQEVHPCFDFENKELSQSILKSIMDNQLEIEPVNEEKPHLKACALSNAQRFCPYRVRISADSEWRQVSLLARNRIAAVCEFYTFVRYLNLGLIRSSIRESYFDIMGLRKNMCLAKLGLGFVPKMNIRPQ